MTDEYQPKDQIIETTLGNDDYEVTVTVRYTNDTGHFWESLPGMAVTVPVAEAAMALMNTLVDGEREAEG